MTPTDHLRRREVLAAGAAGLGALVLGCRPASALRSATSASCVLSPEMTEGPYWIDESLKRRDVTEGMHGVPLDPPPQRRAREHLPRDQERRRRDLARRSRRRVLGVRRLLQQPLPARPPEVRRGGPRPLRHALPGLVPRPHAAHPPEGQRRRRRGPHRPAVHEREGRPRGLPHALLQGARPGRHLARGGHDLRRRRRALDAADPQALGRPHGLRRPPRAGRADLTHQGEEALEPDVAA